MFLSHRLDRKYLWGALKDCLMEIAYVTFYVRAIFLPNQINRSSGWNVIETQIGRWAQITSARALSIDTKNIKFGLNFQDEFQSQKAAFNKQVKMLKNFYCSYSNS